MVGTELQSGPKPAILFLVPSLLCQGLQVRLILRDPDCSPLIPPHELVRVPDGVGQSGAY